MPKSTQCDGTNNCGDRSDEKECGGGGTGGGSRMCSQGEWTCNSGQCIRADRKCDQFQDCVDNSDEKFCTGTGGGTGGGSGSLSCRTGEFVCEKSRKCIMSSRKCDGIPDCDYGEDESNCNVRPGPVGILFL